MASPWWTCGAASAIARGVRQLLAHQAGLAAIDAPITLATARDLDALALAIAPQRPAWQPGTRHGYHGMTIGFYEGELLRRIDPPRRSLGRYFQDEVALRRPDDLFLPENRDIEFRSGGGIGEPRSIARIYGNLATGGRGLGLRAETLSALAGPARPPTQGLRDVILHTDTSFSLGFWKPFSAFRFGGPAGTAFGTPGVGGSFGFADPAVGLGFAYAPKRMGFRIWDDARERSLRDAVYQCLTARPAVSLARP
jgi:CubicO group peptidase (beta-lactamase class C family)